MSTTSPSTTRSLASPPPPNSPPPLSPSSHFSGPSQSDFRYRETLPSSSSTNATAAQRTSDSRRAFDALFRDAGVANIEAQLHSKAVVTHDMAKAMDEQDAQLVKETEEIRREGDEMERWLKRDVRGERVEEGSSKGKGKGGAWKGLGWMGWGGKGKEVKDEGKQREEVLMSAGEIDDFEESMRAIERDLDLLDSALDDVEGKRYSGSEGEDAEEDDRSGNDWEDHDENVKAVAGEPDASKPLQEELKSDKL